MSPHNKSLMTNLPKHILTYFVVCCSVAGGIAQQDAMFTKYMFNSLSYNPAYAGSKDYMAIGVLHRQQWIGIEGAPVTQTVTAHTPLPNDKVGVGLSIYNDAIGPTGTTGVNASYAYRLPVGEGLRLSVGLQGGVENYRTNFSKLSLQNQQDGAYDDQPSLWLPNFGAGLFLFGERFYAGFSSPHLIEYDLRESDDPNVEVYSRRYRHYYAAVGAAFPVRGDDIVFKPSILFKNVGMFSRFSKEEISKTIGAPSEADFDVSFLFYQKFWVGASFRTALSAFDGRSSFDSADLWFSWNLDNGIRVGAAYDYPLTELNTVTAGAFELMVGYEFNFLTKRMVTPRYF